MHISLTDLLVYGGGPLECLAGTTLKARQHALWKTLLATAIAKDKLYGGAYGSAVLAGGLGCWCFNRSIVNVSAKF